MSQGNDDRCKWPTAGQRTPGVVALAAGQLALRIVTREHMVGLLEVSVSAGTSGPVLALVGEADVLNVAVVHEALVAQISRQARHLTVDLSGLRFADSPVVRELVLAARALAEGGGEMELVAPQDAVARVLRLQGVDQVIPVRDGAGYAAEPDSE